MLLRGRFGGEDASDCGRQRLVSGGGLKAKCPTDTGLITLSPITNDRLSDRQATGSQAVLLCYKIPTGVFVCVRCVWRV